jgi:hypothetical protein
MATSSDDDLMVVCMFDDNDEDARWWRMVFDVQRSFWSLSTPACLLFSRQIAPIWHAHLTSIIRPAKFIAYTNVVLAYYDITREQKCP